MSRATFRIGPVLLLALATVFPCDTSFGFTKSGSTFLTDGSQSDVNAAITASSDGDVVLIPAGSFTWGDGKTYISVPKAITLKGAGQTSTIINASSTGPTGTNALIRIFASATISDFTFKGGSASVPAFSASSANGWRISRITYLPSAASYFCLVNSVYGVIENCNITSGSGGNELIFGRGPGNAWQTDTIPGSNNAVYIENCIFHKQGYVCDANSNARFVVRFCTINGPMKIDGHGLASNTPARGVRLLEAYGNRWTSIGESGYWPSIEFRGGTGYLFDNTVDDNTYPGRGVLRLAEYGATSIWGNFGNLHQTPADYPVKDQVGVGMDPKAAASEPVYVWNYRKAGVLVTPNWAAIPQAAIDRYRAQTGDPTATFTMQDIIKADRDYFIQGATFDGSTGVGRGTKAQMLAITPTTIGVGYWVTDEGEWNSLQDGPDGQLYVWNGSAWTFKYRPFTYPYPHEKTPPTPPARARVK